MSFQPSCRFLFYQSPSSDVDLSRLGLQRLMAGCRRVGELWHISLKVFKGTIKARVSWHVAEVAKKRETHLNTSMRAKQARWPITITAELSTNWQRERERAALVLKYGAG